MLPRSRVGRVLELGPVKISVAAHARPDGYRPIAESLFRWALLGNTFPADEVTRHFLSAARRLDAAHMQFERVRAGVDEGLESPGSIAGRRIILATVGDVELALIALNRVITMAMTIREKWTPDIALPDVVETRREAIKELRNAYEHIDSRAAGLLVEKGKTVANPEALTVFAYGDLFEKRRVTYRTWSLAIDDQATEIMIATRDFLVAAWNQATASASRNDPYTPS